MIDLRSDTVTQPTEAMREAMAHADVGDDVLGDDPTVNALEARTAELLGFEAAVFMPSGTMTNQIAIRTHTEPGDEILLHEESHVYIYEGGAPAALSGVMVNLLPGERGIVTPETLRQRVRPCNIHHPVPKLLCLENTHNRGGGSVWPMATLAATCQAARHLGLKCHLDGARIWNAAVALGTPEADIARHFDSVSVCFSKGLGAPVGSALAGSKAFVDRARRFRKMFGGGMRQAGIIAAGALYALEHHRSRLADDHAHATKLAETLAELPGVTLDLDAVETNIVYFDVEGDAKKAAGSLLQQGVGVLALGPSRIRAVTHLHITDEALGEAIDAFGKVFA